ncbi:hypothetical protein GGR26_002912 [Lewinella marina]|uniref:Gliding motility lipoprotein GldB n=1 Tax=Neolewinella marina TaxID=438751 RepID=A0A2G0CBH6_9BACT|nr:hypothetical protein [Neolewinella marina]NJB87135.1 hypothetical protein [Neolewinella marina]PHK97338.1 hypothetical protein CGL56_16155 [Neolewinella marina]
MKVSNYLFLPLLFLTFTSCSEEPPPPDVSDIEVDLTVLRFDQALTQLDTSDLPAELERLDDTYGSFTDAFFTHLVPVRRGDFSAEEGQNVLRAYLEYPLTRVVDSTVAEHFSPEGGGAQVPQMVEDFRQGLRYFRHYLPDAPLPDTLVTFNTHFELAAFLYGEGQIAVGLEFFLGPDFDYALVNPEEPIFSDYLAQSYTPAHFTGKLLRVLVEDRFPPPRSGRLIDYLIYEGKKLYLLELLQPATPDHVVYEVTEEQMDWLRDNETPIYAYLQREDILYSTDVNRINKYTRPAPYTPGMPVESPGGAVNYLGRQIVAAYMAAHPEVSLTELMEMTDGQEILRGARYKPR